MDADELYALPLTEFVAARGALAKELKAAGDKDAAAEVATLAKPSVAAWAVNQVVRSGDLEELVEAGEALRDAQAALLAGDGDRAAMRAATVSVREAVGALGRAAAELEGVGDAVVERVRETFQAAAVDPDAREQVLGGRLVKELVYSGIAAGVGGSAAPARGPARRPGEPKVAPQPTRRATPKPKRSRGDDGERDAAARKAEAAKAREAERARKAEEAREAAERERLARERKAAEKALATAERAVAKARDRRDRAAAALDEAENELERAASERDEARSVLDDLG